MHLYMTVVEGACPIITTAHNEDGEAETKTLKLGMAQKYVSSHLVKRANEPVTTKVTGESGI